MTRKKYLSILLLAIILIAGILLRVWDFGNHPAGLNQDEASIAVEAASLYHYGADRNGQAFPVQFISWGSGQNVLYAYLLAPLTPLGLTPAVIRFPMLISGLLSIGLMYLIGRKLFSETTGMIAAFLMAISPWNVMLSRWALESNLFPFVFLLGFLFLIYFDRRWYFLPIGCAFLGLSLYAYGTAYFVVPLFLLSAFILLLAQKRISWRPVAAGLGVAVLLAVPIGLFLAVNTLKLPGMQLGPFSIPRLPAQPRLFLVTAAGSTSLVKTLLQNGLELVRILFLQKDGLIYNSLPAFGFLFSGAILFAFAGVGRIIPEVIRDRKPGTILFIVWLILSLILGVVQEPNINRINILFPALILLVAVALEWIFLEQRVIFIGILAGILMSESIFAYEYFGQQYRANLSLTFYDGILPALESIPADNHQSVCVTDRINMPYIYVLLVHPDRPSDILQNLHYINPGEAFQVPDRYRNYYFGISHCPGDTAYWILAQEDIVPDSMAGNTLMGVFDNFSLYRAAGLKAN